jgi:glycosyltransferase involved in cell wall biosynthesis
MRILWFSWRDIKNPEAGGAEVFTYEVTRRLVKRGYDITLFTARFPGGSLQENIDGINVVRDSGRYSVYNKAKKYYQYNKESFDLVIDEINVKPFLTPKFVKGKPILALVHQVPRKGLFYELPFPINYITYHYLVKRWFSNYRHVPTITVSESQREILRTFGFQKIFVVPNGLGVVPLDQVPIKNPYPTVAFIGRLKRYKLPDHAVKAFSIIKEKMPDAKMFVIGDGYVRTRLENMNVKDVTFFGKVDDQTKYDLLSKTHILLVPSVEEGWGLVVIEANAMGTPSIAYNVAGLRDSVRHEHTGILVDSNSPEELAKAAIILLNDKEKLARLSRNALEFAKGFSWDNTAQALDQIIRTVFRDYLTTVT